MKQSILYVATSFSTVARITAPFISLELNLQNERAGYFFAFMVNAVVPLQGLFTLIIFVRLDYLRRRQIVEADGHTKSRWQCSRECLFSPDMQSSNTRRRRSLISCTWYSYRHSCTHHLPLLGVRVLGVRSTYVE